MSQVQFDLTILVLIILISIIITILYRKYSLLKELENKTTYFENKSSIVSFPPGFLPRVLFLILRKMKENKLRKLILAHNLLCIVGY